MICRNSWGTDWGDEGYFYMPYEFVAMEPRQIFDFWLLETVQEDGDTSDGAAIGDAPIARGRGNPSRSEGAHPVSL